jgi:hypothetical protein
MTPTITINGWANEPAKTNLRQNPTYSKRRRGHKKARPQKAWDESGDSRSEGAQGGLDPEQILDDQEGPSISQFRGCLDGMGTSPIETNLTEPILSERIQQITKLDWMDSTSIRWKLFLFIAKMILHMRGCARYGGTECSTYRKSTCRYHLQLVPTDKSDGEPTHRANNTVD